MEKQDPNVIAAEASAKAAAAAKDAAAISANAAETSKNEAAASAQSVEQAKTEIIGAINNATTALKAVPNTSTTGTPSKTTIRYINDTLFASNFGSILVSLVNFSKEMIHEGSPKINYPGTEVLLFGLFFIIFRIKAYLDDNNSLIKKESQVKASQKKEPKGWEKAGFVVSLISWLLYSISGFFIFTNSDYSHLFFASSLVVFTLWIVLSMFNRKGKQKNGAVELKVIKENDADKENHKIYLITNLIYLFFFSILLCGFLISVCDQTWLTGYWNLFNKIPNINMWCLTGLLLTVLVDFGLSKSLNHCYR